MSVGHVQVSPAAGQRQRQIQLPNSKAFQIALNSIKIRLGRSIITAAGILLGIAFFTSVRMSAVFTDIQAQTISEKRAAIAAGTLKPTPDDIRLISSADENKADEQASKARLTWLSYMALIVCTVGITNAMLMSVTERYKEIGTMKCLGALDSLIVKLFFIESCLLGFFASVAGFLVGWAVISLVHLLVDGLSAFNAQYLAGSLQQLVLSIVIGTFLTFLATIAPAMRAARMPAAAALRVEI